MAKAFVDDCCPCHYAEYAYMIPGFTYGSSITLSYPLGKELAE